MKIEREFKKSGATPNWMLANQISEDLKVNPYMVLGFIGKWGFHAVRMSYEESRTGNKPVALFLHKIKNMKLE